MITAEPIKMPVPKPGLYPDVDEDTYHAWPCASYSRLKGMACPAKVRFQIDNPNEPTEAMIRGSVFDCLVLTPADFDKRFVVPATCCAVKEKGGRCENPGTICIGGEWFCGVHLRSKAKRHDDIRAAITDGLILDGFRVTHTSPSGSAYLEREDGQKRRVSDHAPTKKVKMRMLSEHREDVRIDLPPYGNDDAREKVAQKILDQTLMMRDRVLNHKEAADILRHCSHRQLSGAFRDEETGLIVKLRPDIWCDGIRVMGDLKATSEGADAESFASTVFKRAYHIQAALYPHGMSVLGKIVEDFAFIVTEVEDPFVTAVHRIGEKTLQAGRNMFDKFKQVYRDCEESGEWPAYPGISDVEMSDYHLRRCGVNPKQLEGVLS